MRRKGKCEENKDEKLKFTKYFNLFGVKSAYYSMPQIYC